MNYITPGTFRATLLLAAMAGLFIAIGSLFGVLGMASALALAIVIGFWSFWHSGPAIVAASGARELTLTTDRRVLDTVSRLSAAAGVPMPHVFEIDDPHPNAFAVGANPKQASLILTKGLRKALSKDQLAAIIGHELAHIRSRDTLAATIGAVFLEAIIGLAMILALVGIIAHKHGGCFLIILSIFFPVIALVLHLAASRSREYEADRYGAELTGGPQAMIAALKSLSKRPTSTQVAIAAPATAALWFVDPLVGAWLSHLLSTHPPIERRIARLERVTARKS
jgi:heat shock protein HtpX